MPEVQFHTGNLNEPVSLDKIKYADFQMDFYWRHLDWRKSKNVRALIFSMIFFKLCLTAYVYYTWMMLISSNTDCWNVSALHKLNLEWIFILHSISVDVMQNWSVDLDG